MIKLGNNDITLKVGSADVSAAYLGSVLVYSGGTPPTPVIPDNTIIYEASAKLSEAPSEYEAGLHTNSFSGTNGQQLTITSHTFENGVGTIEFDGDIASIGNGAFYGCTTLTSITIPNGVTSINVYAFWKCSGLTSVTIGSGVTSIGDMAFSECTSLTSVTIPNSVITIGTSAFNDCSGLTSVTIGNGVTSIGNEAFRQCTSLTSVTIGSGVTSIGSMGFRYCRSLTSITVNATTPPALADINVFDDTNNCPIYVPAASVSAYKSAANWSNLASRIKAIP